MVRRSVGGRRDPAVHDGVRDHDRGQFRVALTELRHNAHEAGFAIIDPLTAGSRGTSARASSTRPPISATGLPQQPGARAWPGLRFTSCALGSEITGRRHPWHSSGSTPTMWHRSGSRARVASFTTRHGTRPVRSTGKTGPCTGTRVVGEQASASALRPTPRAGCKPSKPVWTQLTGSSSSQGPARSGVGG